MDVVEAIRTRKTVRRFSSRQVADGLIEGILDAARRAPSASNTQPWRFIVVRAGTRRAALAEAAFGQKAVSTAPVVIVVCGDPAAMKRAAQMERWVEFRRAGIDEELAVTGVIDAVRRVELVREKEIERVGEEYAIAVSLASNVAIAVSFMTLQAHEMGLGSCWIGAFSREEVRKIAEVPDSIEVLWLLALGYPDIAPAERPRKPIAELVRYETWETERCDI